VRITLTREIAAVGEPRGERLRRIGDDEDS
jgi:hypothetical protein